MVGIENTGSAWKLTWRSVARMGLMSSSNKVCRVETTHIKPGLVALHQGQPQHTAYETTIALPARSLAVSDAHEMDRHADGDAWDRPHFRTLIHIQIHIGFRTLIHIQIHIGLSPGGCKFAALNVPSHQSTTAKSLTM